MDGYLGKFQTDRQADRWTDNVNFIGYFVYQG